MRALTARSVAGGAAAGSIALMAGGLALAYVDRHALPIWPDGLGFPDVFMDVVNMGVPVLGFVLASRRPAKRMGWLFLAAGLALGLSGLSNQYALHALVAAPGSLPAGRAVAWFSNWIWVIQVAGTGLPPSALSDGAAALPAVASGRVVPGRGVHVHRGWPCSCAPPGSGRTRSAHSVTG